MSVNRLPKPRFTEFMLREHDLATALSALTRWDTLSGEELISLGFAPSPSSDPTEEIEVTPEMAEAGAAELARYTDVFDTLEDGATRIFRAMVRVIRQKEASA